jgi:hypothetical protein
MRNSQTAIIGSLVSTLGLKDVEEGTKKLSGADAWRTFDANCQLIFGNKNIPIGLNLKIEALYQKVKEDAAQGNENRVRHGLVDLWVTLMQNNQGNSKQKSAIQQELSALENDLGVDLKSDAKKYKAFIKANKSLTKEEKQRERSQSDAKANQDAATEYAKLENQFRQMVDKLPKPMTSDHKFDPEVKSDIDNMYMEFKNLKAKYSMDSSIDYRALYLDSLKILSEYWSSEDKNKDLASRLNQGYDSDRDMLNYAAGHLLKEHRQKCADLNFRLDERYTSKFDSLQSVINLDTGPVKP